MQYMICEKCGNNQPTHMICESYTNAREVMVRRISEMEDIYDRNRILGLIDENDWYKSSDGSYSIGISDKEVEPGQWESAN